MARLNQDLLLSPRSIHDVAMHGATFRDIPLSDALAPDSLFIHALRVRVMQLIKDKRFKSLNILNEMVAQSRTKGPMFTIQNGRTIISSEAQALRVAANGEPAVCSYIEALPADQVLQLLSVISFSFLRTVPLSILTAQISYQAPCLLEDGADLCIYGLEHAGVPFPASLLITPLSAGMPITVTGHLHSLALDYLRQSI